MNIYTEKIIYWIEYHDYSRNHWETIAKEILEEKNNNLDEAIIQLSFSIRSFHLKFQDAVVKPGNVLYDLIDNAYINVDWDQVARRCYKNLNLC
jgi:hypothetical protein